MLFLRKSFDFQYCCVIFAQNQLFYIMKRIKIIISIVIITLLSGCEEGNRYDKYAPRGVFLYPIANNTSMRSIINHNSSMMLDIMHHNEEYRQWRDSNDIEEYLENQWKEYLGRPFRPEEAASLLYGKLMNITITSDYEIAGRKVGENLADLFLVDIGGPMFIFPEGSFVFIEERKELSFEEFMNGNYFYPSNLLIRLNAGNMQGVETPTFTITLTLTDGTSEKTLTSSCTLEV